MNVSKIQCCQPRKKSDNSSGQSFGLGLMEEKTVGQATAELGSALKREAGKKIEEAKPVIKNAKEKAIEGLAQGAEKASNFFARVSKKLKGES